MTAAAVKADASFGLAGVPRGRAAIVAILVSWSGQVTLTSGRWSTVMPGSGPHRFVPDDNPHTQLGRIDVHRAGMVQVAEALADAHGYEQSGPWTTVRQGYICLVQPSRAARVQAAIDAARTTNNFDSGPSAVEH